MAASNEPSEDGHNIVLSDVHVHAERSSQSILQSISERHHSEEKTLSRFYFAIPRELDDTHANATSQTICFTSTSRGNCSSFYEKQKRDADLDECFGGKANFQEEEKVKCLHSSSKTATSPSDVKNLLDQDGDLVVSRKKVVDTHNQGISQRSSSLLGTDYSLSNISLQGKKLGVITIEHKMGTPLKDVGYQLWAGALLLCDYLLHIGSNIQKKDSAILDLGAGLGITSIVAAMFSPTVICTDYRTDILAQAELNWHKNKWLLPQIRCEDILFKVLDWTIEDNFHIPDDDKLKDKYRLKQKDQQTLDSVTMILAAEVIYDDELTDAFFRTIYHLLLLPPSKDVILTLERRIVFTTEICEVCSPAYEHFQDNMEDLISVDDGPVRFCAEKISTSFPQFFKYTRNNEMELWKISSRFTDTDLEYKNCLEEKM